MIASDEITVSGISFNHGTNGEYEFYAHTDHTGVLWQAWRRLRGQITPEDFRGLIDSFVEVSGPQPGEILEAMRKQDALTEELRGWLDSKTSPKNL